MTKEAFKEAISSLFDKNGWTSFYPMRQEVEKVIDEHFAGADEYREEHRRDKERKNALIANLADRVLKAEKENAQLREQLERVLADFGKAVTDKNNSLTKAEMAGSARPPAGPPPPGHQENPVFAWHASGSKDIADSLYVNGPGRIARPIPAACYDQPNRQVNHPFTGREPISSMTVFQEISLRMFAELYRLHGTLAPAEYASQAIDATKALFAGWQKEGWA